MGWDHHQVRPVSAERRATKGLRSINLQRETTTPPTLFERAVGSFWRDGTFH
jgi:hypothetical protein